MKSRARTLTPWSGAALPLAIPLLLLGCVRVGMGVGPAPRAGAAAPCFPIETLPAPDRALAEQILLELGDGEGLYTLADGLKPISSDVRPMPVRIAPSLDTTALETLDRVRRVSAALHCGPIGVMVQVFTTPTPLRDSTMARSTALVVHHTEALRATVRRHATFFGTLGVTPAATPMEILTAVETAPRADRWRGYGYLFGYPDAAVDFFVQAGVDGDRTGQLVPRDFRRIETVRRFPSGRPGEPPLSSFVYAVPKGAAPSAGDLALQAAAAPVYARYVALRAQFIAADSSGAVALWRAWHRQSPPGRDPR